MAIHFNKQHKEDGHNEDHDDGYDEIKYEFSDVRCTVKHGELEILHGVKGMLIPGTTTIIMGPSGSGKTTLLNVLSMKIMDGVEGKFLINGQERTKKIKNYMGYVLQDDYFFARATVLETIKYTAKLRMNIRDARDVEELANVVLDIMGLSHVKNTIVGDAFERGISGGQRKRLSIANEILCNPPLLLMDEPTSGLDSFSAQSLVECIQRIASISNTTIISSLHQPSSQVFGKFDRLIALTNGYIIYQGKTTDLGRYLKRIGFICPFGWNIADYLMDILNDKKFESVLLENYQEYLLHDPETGYSMNIEAITNTVIHDDYDKFFEEMEKKKQIRTKTDNKLDKKLSSKKLSIQEIHSRQEDELKLKGIEKLISLKQERTPYYRQYMLLFLRGYKKIVGDEVTLIKVVDLTVILALFGILWKKAFEVDSEDTLPNSVGAIFFTLSYWTFYPAYLSLYSFPSEREVIARERNVKTYNVSNYFFSKMSVDIVFFFCLIVFWIFVTHLALYWGFNFRVFIAFVFITLLNALISSSIGFFISTIFSNFSKAISFLSLVLLSMTLTNGFYIEIQNLDVPFRYLQWLSYQTYSASILAQVKFNDVDILCSPVRSAICNPQNKLTHFPGKMVVETKFVTLNIWISIFILVMYFAVIKACTYITLRWSNALKMK